VKHYARFRYCNKGMFTLRVTIYSITDNDGFTTDKIVADRMFFTYTGGYRWARRKLIHYSLDNNTSLFLRDGDILSLHP